MPQDKDFRAVVNAIREGKRKPLIMGILNLTPDSFYDGGSYAGTNEVVDAASRMISDGAAILDIGAVSTRPGSVAPDAEEEWIRMKNTLLALRRTFPEILISIDTYRAEVARRAISEGADIINDVSAGMMDTEMCATIGSMKVSYIAMHMQGTPQNMQLQPHYTNVTAEVIAFLSERVQLFEAAGSPVVIADPGFGFGKTIAHNYQLLHELEQITSRFPTLVGVSRKSMIYKVLQTTATGALNGTTVANTVALIKGAHILRVHDVKEAHEVVEIVSMMKSSVT
jgi:dihydropteroate synthase